MARTRSNQKVSRTRIGHTFADNNVENVANARQLLTEWLLGVRDGHHLGHAHLDLQQVMLAGQLNQIQEFGHR